MKKLFLALLLSLPVYAGPGEISGEIALAKGTTLKPGGVLFVFARAGEKGMPAAVLRIPSPKFPVKFSLSNKDAMAPGTPFAGAYFVTARYSVSGDAMDKSGPTGVTAQAISVGKDQVKIEIK